MNVAAHCSSKLSKINSLCAKTNIILILMNSNPNPNAEEVVRHYEHTQNTHTHIVN